MSPTTQDVRAVTSELAIEIEAPPATVWKALTTEIDDWWLPDFHMIGEGSVLTLAAKAGGQLLETAPGGGSLLWYTVQMCTPGESLRLVGHSAPPWGGPNTTMLHLALEESDTGTLLRVQDAVFGHVSDKGVAQAQEGWRQLFGDGLKRHVEERSSDKP